MNQTQLDRIEQKVDQYHAEMLQKLHGDRGDNGLYGRMQSVEHTLAVLRWGARALWCAMLAAISGVWAALTKGG